MLKWSKKKVKILRIKSDKASTYSTINVFSKCDALQQIITLMCVFHSWKIFCMCAIRRTCLREGTVLVFIKLPIVINRFVLHTAGPLITDFNSPLNFRYYCDVTPTLQLTVMQSSTKFAPKATGKIRLYLREKKIVPVSIFFKRRTLSKVFFNNFYFLRRTFLRNLSWGWNSQVTHDQYLEFRTAMPQRNFYRLPIKSWCH